MDQMRFDEAMARISQALKRTEMAAQTLLTRPREQPAGGDTELRQRVTAVIGELDDLIAGLER